MRFILVALLIFAGELFGQSRVPQFLPNYEYQPVHFGIMLGINSFNYQFVFDDAFLIKNDVQNVEVTKFAGFTVGPITDFNVSEHINFRTGVFLSLTQRDLNFNYIKRTIDSVYDETQIMKIETVYAELPIWIKYRAVRVHNYRPYVLAGFSTRFDFNAKSARPEDLPKFTFKNIDYGLEFGVGIEYYTPYVKFSPEIRFMQGSRNVLQPDDTDFSKAIKTVYNSAIVFVIIVEI